MKAYGTLPIGFQSVDQNRRYRRPLSQRLHWNRYNSKQYRRHEQDYYESTLRPFLMYRNEELLDDRPDRDEKLRAWSDAFMTSTVNPSGVLESEADFSAPRAVGQATRNQRKK